jgi:hypothetical protein
MIKIYCDGRECREYVTSRDGERFKGWTEVEIRPLNGGDLIRKVLCRVCTRIHKGAFKDG